MIWHSLVGFGKVWHLTRKTEIRNTAMPEHDNTRVDEPVSIN